MERFEVRSCDGTMLPVYRSGTGLPLVLVHGAGGDHSTWDAVLPYLESHHTLLAIDRRSRFVEPLLRYPLKREFEDVAAVANSTNVEVDLIGQSSGAVCALGASLLIPNLRKLVLYEPPFLTGSESNIDNMERLVGSGELEGAAESFLRHSVKLSPETIAAMKAEPNWPAIVARAPFQIREEAVLRAWRPHPDDFCGLRVPTLLLVGSKTPAEHHHRGYIEFLWSAGVNLTVAEIPGRRSWAGASAFREDGPRFLGGSLMSEVRIVRPNERDTSTAQTPGMFRAEGCGAKTVGAESIWVGHVSVDKGVRSGPHHHGGLESAIYIISGRARFRYGDRLENVVEAQAGDFIFVPPYLVHQEINASGDEPVDMVVARSSQENVVVNVELPQEVSHAE